MADTVPKKINNPTISIKREGYKVNVTIGSIDKNATKLYVRFIAYYNTSKTTIAQDIKKDVKKDTKSFTFTLEKNLYYPYKGDKTDKKYCLKKIEVRCYAYMTYTEKGVTKKKTSSTITKAEALFDKPTTPSCSESFDSEKMTLTYHANIPEKNTMSQSGKNVASRIRWSVKELERNTKTNKWVEKHVRQASIWANSNVTKNYTQEVNNPHPNPDRVWKYNAYLASPGGQSSTVTKYHVLAIPRQVKELTVARNTTGRLVNGCYYDLSFNYDSKYTFQGGTPSETIKWLYNKFVFEYLDSDIILSGSTAESQSWKTIDDTIKDRNPVNALMQADSLVANNKVRYFRVGTVYDGMQVNKLADYHEYGTIDPVAVGTVSAVTTSSGTVVSWGKPDIKLSTAAVYVYRDNTKIASIAYNSNEWNAGTWTDQSVTTATGNNKYTYSVSVGVQENITTTDEKGNEKTELKVMKESSRRSAANESTLLDGLNVVKLSDGKSVELTWNTNSLAPANSGIEIAWSTDIDAFKSTVQPSTKSFSDSKMTAVKVTGLSEDSTYYFWARRFTENGSEKTCGDWAATDAVVMSGASAHEKAIVELQSDWALIDGGINIMWEPRSNKPITRTRLIVHDAENTDGEAIIDTVFDDERTICAYILFSDYEGLFSENKRYTVQIETTDSDGVQISDGIDFAIVTPPEIAIATASFEQVTRDGDDETDTALTRLPLTFTVDTGNSDVDLTASLIVDGNFIAERPYGKEYLFDGDTVYTDNIEPDENGIYTIDNVKLIDGCRYILKIDGADRKTWLTTTAEQEFVVIWEHEAPKPLAAIQITDIDTAGGEKTGAIITTAVPDEAADGDVYDIYRGTADGVYLAVSDVKPGETVIDLYPSIGSGMFEPYYVISTRTKDGAEDYAEFPYTYKGTGTIIDYGDGRLQLPYGTDLNDKHTKNGETRVHLGGTVTYFSSPVITHKQTLKTTLVSMVHEEIIRQLSEMARFTGVCYVRTSYGYAYPAVVDVEIDRTAGNAAVSVNIETEEVNTSDEYMATIESEGSV